VDWLQEILVCPRDRAELSWKHEELICAAARHSYPNFRGVPVLLLSDETPTHGWQAKTLEVVRGDRPVPEYQEPGPRDVDPFVQENALYTCGNLYRRLDRLPHYPVPELRFPPARSGQLFLDIGCNWGRWSIAAANLGYKVVGVDLVLPAVQAARRIASQLDLDASFLVADARHLPFRDATFDVVFSYSVFQHFSKDATRAALLDIARILKPGGAALVQMANTFGLKNLAYRARRSLTRRDPSGMRYWRPSELEKSFSELIGPSQLEVDGFFSLNPQTADLDLLPRSVRPVVRASELLRRASQHYPILVSCADSLYVRSRRQG
jgi:SAM-dependent methyltransferase/uncharacterized protein YbaR (Trm112 family)